MKSIFARSLLLSCALAVPASAIDIIVPLHFATIQEAIDFAVGGDTVWVMPGTYPENLDFGGKPITVRSFLFQSVLPGVEPGLHDTVIDGQGAGSVVVFAEAEGPNSVLEGFTIENGSGTVPLGELLPFGGGILCVGSSPTLRGNVVRSSSATYGGGIACLGNASPTIVSTLVHDSVADFGGGIYCDISSSPTVTNVTLADNVADAAGGGMYCSNGSDALVTNSILWNNTAPVDPEVAVLAAAPVITYSDVLGGWPGTGNIGSDPLFLDPGLADYHIDDNSPCFNKGDLSAPSLPLTDYEADTRTGFGALVTGTPDMGADEYFFVTSAVWVVPGSISAGNSGWLYIWSGQPGELFLFLFAFDQRPFPLQTQFGEFWLAPYFAPPLVFSIYEVYGTFPPRGTIDLNFTVPPNPILPPLLCSMQVITEGTLQLSPVGTVALSF